MSPLQFLYWVTATLNPESLKGLLDNPKLYSGLESPIKPKDLTSTTELVMKSTDTSENSFPKML